MGKTQDNVIIHNGIVYDGAKPACAQWHQGFERVFSRLRKAYGALVPFISYIIYVPRAVVDVYLNQPIIASYGAHSGIRIEFVQGVSCGMTQYGMIILYS